MEIAKAIQGDIREVMRIVERVIEKLRSEGSDQWDERYPSRELLASDIEHGSLYAARENGKMIAFMTLDEDQSEEYRDVSWSKGVGKILVVHRLAVAPERQGKGVAKRMMDYAEDMAREMGYSAIRLDAYTGNPAALAIYEKRGYSPVGKVNFPWRSKPFNCYEKLL